MTIHSENETELAAHGVGTSDWLKATRDLTLHAYLPEEEVWSPLDTDLDHELASMRSIALRTFWNFEDLVDSLD